ncbi:MAG: hypothetical protein L0216_01550 [Planctomycetales bacterium]|nr:hypothetical protein [Planctomycetales bacterium]
MDSIRRRLAGVEGVLWESRDVPTPEARRGPEVLRALRATRPDVAEAVERVARLRLAPRDAAALLHHEVPGALEALARARAAILGVPGGAAPAK